MDWLWHNRHALLAAVAGPVKVCALCGEPITDTDPGTDASDGQLVHERCESDYEDNVYFREFDE